MNEHKLTYFVLARFSGPVSARGATLIVALLFLVVMTMVVVAGSQTSIMEERMSGYARDRGIAYETLHNMMGGYLQKQVLPNLNVDQIGTGCIYSQATAPNYRTMTWAGNAGVCTDPNTSTDADNLTANSNQNAVSAPLYFIFYKNSIKFAGADGGFVDVWNVDGYETGMNPSTYVIHEQSNMQQ